MLCFISKFANNFFTDSIDSNQFGDVPGRSTTLALLKIMHKKKQTQLLDLLVDFTKAFDLNDNNVLANMFLNYGIPLVFCLLCKTLITLSHLAFQEKN